MGLLISLARYGGCDLKSAGQAHSLYSRCLGYALPMVLSTNFPCSQWALIPNEGDGYEKYFKNNAYDDYNFYDSRFCCLCRGNTGFRSGSVNNEQRLDRNQ